MPSIYADSFSSPGNTVATELVAVLVAVTQGQPRVLTRDGTHALPAGPFESSHRSLQAGLRTWVEAQTHHPLGYVEQLYTFADGDRANQQGQRIISVSYLGLTRELSNPDIDEVGWQDWYRYFPWEDWRDGRPDMIAQQILPALSHWCNDAPAAEMRQRRQRVAYTFGTDAAVWSEDMVLQRYELLFEAGLVPEAIRRSEGPLAVPMPGDSMVHDHRRILATAVARLRAKIRYRPMVFELMPPEFTLLQLQQAFEGVAGRRLHKQNFRRFIEQQALVEDTGQMAHGTAGRPAKLFQFRSDVLRERAIFGSKLPLAK
ncbi:hypothetical protein [Pollutimonas bauzanensis]|jgi:hypothetical protein|uniref:NUDIX hydrolase n=1 Tax=Pollutimonas bauzanensis TaxID=658167 RepID=UPI003340B688